jgi:flagellar protein FliS
MLMDVALERLEAAWCWRIAGSATDLNPQRLQSAILIILELRASLDLDQGGPIAANVDQLYDYMCRRLSSSVGLPNGLAALHEVSHLLHALRSAWPFMRPSGQRGNPQRGPCEVRIASGN